MAASISRHMRPYRRRANFRTGQGLMEKTGKNPHHAAQLGDICVRKRHQLRLAVMRSVFLRDVGFLAWGVAIAQIALLACSPILTRLFTPEAFGAFSLVMAAAGMISVFATLRLESILPAVKSTVRALHLLQLLLMVAAAVSAVALAAVIAFGDGISAALSMPAGGSASLYALPALVMTFAAYSGVRSWLIRQGRFKPIGRGQVGRVAVCLTVSIGLGVAGAFAKAPGLALAVGQAAGDFFYGLALLRHITPRELRVLATPRLSRIRKALAANSGIVRALVSAQALAAIYGRLPIIAIAAAFGPAPAGWYALAERVTGAPTALIANAIGDVYRQRAAAAYHAGKPFDDLMRRVLAMTLALSVVPFVIAMLLTPRYLGLVLGEEWQAAGFTVVVLLVYELVGFNSTPVDKAAIIVGANRYIMIWQTARLVIEVAAALAAIMGWIGYEAYLIAIVAGRSAVYVWDLSVQYTLAKWDRA
jgi:O-antigen/teichoic acid export membrane protein